MSSTPAEGPLSPAAAHTLRRPLAFERAFYKSGGAVNVSKRLFLGASAQPAAHRPFSMASPPSHGCFPVFPPQRSHQEPGRLFLVAVARLPQKLCRGVPLLGPRPSQVRPAMVLGTGGPAPALALIPRVLPFSPLQMPLPQRPVWRLSQRAAAQRQHQDGEPHAAAGEGRPGLSSALTALFFFFHRRAPFPPPPPPSASSQLSQLAFYTQSLQRIMSLVDSETDSMHSILQSSLASWEEAFRLKQQV